MGTWGSELLENDAAADAIGFWNEFVAHGISTDPDFWTSERILGLLRPSLLRAATGADLKDPDRASEILAIGIMFLEANLPIPDELSDLLTRTASVQLERAQLREWGSDARRRRTALEALLTHIGRAPLPASQSLDPDKLEAKQWRAWSKHYPRWVHSALNFVADDKWVTLAPPLIRRLEVMVRHSQGKQELGGASPEIVQHRLMAIAFSLGVFLELPESEVLHLIALAEASKGDIYRRVKRLERPTLRGRLLDAEIKPS